MLRRCPRVLIRTPLEVEDHIAPKDQRVFVGAVVVGRLVVGAFESEFGAESDRASYPVVPGEQVLRVP